MHNCTLVIALSVRNCTVRAVRNSEWCVGVDVLGEYARVCVCVHVCVYYQSLTVFLLLFPGNSPRTSLVSISFPTPWPHLHPVPKTHYLPCPLTTTSQPIQCYSCWCYFVTLLFSLFEISLFHNIFCTNMPNVAHYYLNIQVFWMIGTRICFNFEFNFGWLIIINGFKLDKHLVIL